MLLEVRASELFPWNRSIRTRPGYLAMTFPPSENTITIIEDALRMDPFSADLTYGLAVSNFALNNHAIANAQFRAFANLAPNAARTKLIRKALQ